jgi:hypothetical protein
MMACSWHTWPADYRRSMAGAGMTGSLARLQPALALVVFAKFLRAEHAGDHHPGTAMKWHLVTRSTRVG